MLVRYWLFTVGLIITQILFAQPTSEMRRLLHSYEVYGRLSGVVLVQKGDSVILSESYGCADYTTELPNQVSSIFNIASLSRIDWARVNCTWLFRKLSPRLFTLKYLSPAIWSVKKR